MAIKKITLLSVIFLEPRAFWGRSNNSLNHPFFLHKLANMGFGVRSFDET